MEKAAKDLDFMEAARLRDLMFEAKEKLEKMQPKPEDFQDKESYQESLNYFRQRAGFLLKPKT
jgi:excinuclease UvrABC nuclease subunit